MHLSNDQRRILAHPFPSRMRDRTPATSAEQSDCVVVRACAGSGKTVLMVELARTYADETLIYTSLNPAVAGRTASQLPDNVRCQSLHQLARQALSEEYGDKLKRQQDITRRLSPQSLGWLGSFSSQSRSLMAQGLNTFFAASEAVPMPEHLPEHVAEQLSPAELRQIVESMRLVWDCLLDPADHQQGLSFNALLKLWSQHGQPLDADLVMLDEAQDATPALLAMLRRQRCDLLLIGDPHQSLARQAEGLSSLDSPLLADATVYSLPGAWRFGPSLAALGTRLAACSPTAREQGMSGLGPATRLALPAVRDSLLRNGTRHSVISAGPVAALGEALSLHQRGIAVAWLDGIEGYPLAGLLDHWRLWRCHQCVEQGDMASQRELWRLLPPSLTRLGQTPTQVLGALARLDDHQARGLHELASWYAQAPLDSWIGELRKQDGDLQAAIVSGQPVSMPLVMLGTVFRAKGLEFDCVVLAHDLALPGSRQQLPNQVLVTNLSYTAATRARQLLVLNETLSLWWQAQPESEHFPLLGELPAVVATADTPDSPQRAHAPHPWWGKARLAELALTPRKRLLLRRAQHAHDTSAQAHQQLPQGVSAERASADSGNQTLQRQARSDSTARKLYEMASQLPPGRPPGGLRGLLTPDDETTEGDAARQPSNASPHYSPSGSMPSIDPTEPFDE
ncbi:ATP-dependent helicase [Cobetia sp. QF-1]|uniref:ATP-dependent helicase n=1 Tax=Cobetia sp. QF-1 TaxID=1969833 RepID=UPI000B53DBBC|nr:ATP-dependent helicase [Cobetia sp. QF-1]